MGNVTSHSMTYKELQDFIQQIPLSASTKVQVSFDEISAMNKLLTFIQQNKTVNNSVIKPNTSTANDKTDLSEIEALEDNIDDMPDDFSTLEAFGIWADRAEISDSVAYVRKIREPRF